MQLPVINLCAGMNIYSSLAVRFFRYHSRQQRQTELMQLVGKTIVHHGMNYRIAEQHLIHAARGRIPLIRREDIAIETQADDRQTVGKLLNPPDRLLRQRVTRILLI